MENTVTTNSITIVNLQNNSFSVSCESNVNSDGSVTPILFNCFIPEKEVIVNNVKLLPGELALTSNEEVDVNISKKGELLLFSVKDDSIYKYSRNNENLVYE